MVEVNGAHKHDKYEKNRLKSVCVISSVKVFATQDDRPYVTRLDQNNKQNKTKQRKADKQKNE